MSLPHENAASGNRAQMTGKPIIFSAQTQNIDEVTK